MATFDLLPHRTVVPGTPTSLSPAVAAVRSSPQPRDPPTQHVVAPGRCDTHAIPIADATV